MKYFEQHYKYMDKLLTMYSENPIDVPVFALTVFEDKIISIQKNLKEYKNDPTSHAEMEVIRETALKLNRWRLNDVTLYVTLEPCPMCAAAIIQSRLSTVVFGAYDSLYGSFGSKFDMRNILTSDIKLIGGVREQECTNVLKTFFAEKRN
ncbi:MAG: nucleoside deaminase [bacterium]